MKRYILHVFLFISPIVLLLIPFFVGDPFMCIYKYSSFNECGEPMMININRTYVSTEMYEQYRDTYRWNSFIFGSSRSGFYRIRDWKKHLSDNARCYHFDGYGESIFNIYHKIKYIDGRSPLDNVLICLDDEVLYVDSNEKDQLHCIAPRLTDEVSRWDYWAICLRSYMHPKFLKSYLVYWLTGDVYDYMRDVFDMTPYCCDIETNEHGSDQYPPDSLYYTPERISKFPQRSNKLTYLGFSVIKENQEKMLVEIRDILEKNNSSYKVILNPCYKQVKLIPEDSIKLSSIFGEHLYDFSGINKWTEDFHNYGDPAHFKAFVAAEIMDSIYCDNDIKRY